MEDALRVHFRLAYSRKRSIVLILVVMEDALRDVLHIGMNSFVRAINKYVLILVVMEDALRDNYEE